MKVITLLENTTCREELCIAHGLSQYIETANHKILFDMGPDEGYLANAEQLGVDLTAVDIAFLSHGHNDHCGGMEKFLQLNDHAKIYVQADAFGDYCVVEADGTARSAGVEPAVAAAYADRFVKVTGVTVIDGELTAFDNVEDAFPAVDTSARLQERTAEGLIPDKFHHEHNLIIREGDTAVVFGGCAHRGVVNIRDAAAAILGREPNALVSGFHLFNLTEGNAEGDALIRATAEELKKGTAVYYTGHCTGEHAYGLMETIMGDQLRRITTGGELVL